MCEERKKTEDGEKSNAGRVGMQRRWFLHYLLVALTLSCAVPHVCTESIPLAVRRADWKQCCSFPPEEDTLDPPYSLSVCDIFTLFAASLLPVLRRVFWRASLACQIASGVKNSPMRAVTCMRHTAAQAKGA